MRIFIPGLLLWPLSLLTLVSAFPGSGNIHNAHVGHQGVPRTCPYADAQAQGAVPGKKEHEKRFLFSLMKRPVDSMQQEITVYFVLF